jgi:hypothetical protein
LASAVPEVLCVSVCTTADVGTWMSWAWALLWDNSQEQGSPAAARRSAQHQWSLRDVAYPLQCSLSYESAIVRPLSALISARHGTHKMTLRIDVLPLPAG